MLSGTSKCLYQRDNWDNITGGSAGAHIEDTTTNENTTAPSGGASLGAHVSETSQATSRPSRTVEKYWERTL